MTIIVILILAAVTISFVLGDDGIINKAKEAANAMNNAVANDQASLNELFNELNAVMNGIGGGGELPDPEPELPKLEDTTGIQDETIEVEDEYGNKVTIPKGFEVVEEEGTTVPEGIVIQDKDGNQFVWIPVGRVYKDSTGTNYSDIQLGRYTFDRTNGTPTPVQLAYTDAEPTNYIKLQPLLGEDTYYYEYADRENKDGILSDGVDGLNAIAKNLAGFVESTKENYGYYLGRYEASYGSGSSVADYKPLSKVSVGNPRVNDDASLNIGMLWNFVTQIDAAKISRNMYNNDSNVGVESDLVNSYAWDTAIIFIQEMGNNNYSNATGDMGAVKNTGTNNDEVCNIHDMASNCEEWTTEYSTYKNTKAYPCSYRGGFCFYNDKYTSYRNDAYSTYKYEFYSFRTLIYIK